MGKKLYVGNLAFSTTDDSLAQLFASAGKVESAKIIVDHHSGRSKGFGFVEMSTDDEAQNAIQQFHEKDHDGRKLTVAEARAQQPREGGGGGGRGFGGGGGGGGGRRFGGGGGGRGPRH